MYAVIDATAKTVTLCSAGQAQPIHFSSKTGKASLIETVGDTFPLGILEDVNYEETNIHLSKGDVVIFYTDGIVEAMNKDEKMFGFDRLLELVQASQVLNADELLKKIIDQTNAFVGDAIQHDDLTVIVVRVVS